MATGNQVMERNNAIKTLKTMLEGQKESIAAVLPRHMTPDRLLKVAMVAVGKTPLLLQCSPLSILRCVMTAAELGIDPSGALGEGYMIPFKNKRGLYDAQLIPGYRGLLKLARNSGELSTIDTHVIHEKDTYEIEFGLEPVLKHKPCLDGDPGKPIIVYAIARFKDGAYQYGVMTTAEVESVRARSRSKNDGPWVTDWEEMAKKTMLKRLSKLLPLSPELARAVSLDNAAESGDVQELPEDIIDITGGMIDETETGAFETPTPGTQTKTDEIKKRLAGAKPGATIEAPANVAEPEPEFAQTQPSGTQEPLFEKNQ